MQKTRSGNGSRYRFINESLGQMPVEDNGLEYPSKTQGKYKDYAICCADSIAVVLSTSKSTRRTYALTTATALSKLSHSRLENATCVNSKQPNIRVDVDRLDRNRDAQNIRNCQSLPVMLSSTLARVVDAWPSLQPHLQETILTLLDNVLPRRSASTIQRPNPNQVSNIALELFGQDTDQRETLRRTILKALRHKPNDFGMRMDCDGWVDIRHVGLIACPFIADETDIDLDDVFKLVSDLDFGDRVEVLADCIRATYGHSTKHFRPTKLTIPKEPLFHGTSCDFWPLINTFGLLPGNRRFVQLTSDFDYAQEIAESHKGKPIVIQISTSHATELGVQFYGTSTHVWLATKIPSDCLQLWLVDPPCGDDDWLDSQFSDSPSF